MSLDSFDVTKLPRLRLRRLTKAEQMSLFGGIPASPTHTAHVKGHVRSIGGKLVAVQQHERKVEGGQAHAEAPKPEPAVDSALWHVRNRFGAAGGPRIIELSEKGEERAATVASGLKPEAIRALEDLKALGGSAYIETEHGARITATPFGQTHRGDTLSHLSGKGLIELWHDPDRRERRYRITEAGHGTLSQIEEERARLLERVKKANPMEGAEADPPKPPETHAEDPAKAPRPKQTVAISIEQGIGYTGKHGAKAYIASITGADDRYGFERDFLDADRVERDSFNKAKYTRTYHYELSEGLYEISEGGEKKYNIASVLKDGRFGRFPVTEERARAMAELMTDGGMTFAEAKLATKKTGTMEPPEPPKPPAPPEPPKAEPPIAEELKPKTAQPELGAYDPSATPGAKRQAGTEKGRSAASKYAEQIGTYGQEHRYSQASERETLATSRLEGKQDADYMTGFREGWKATMQPVIGKPAPKETPAPAKPGITWEDAHKEADRIFAEQHPKWDPNTYTSIAAHAKLMSSVLKKHGGLLKAVSLWGCLATLQPSMLTGKKVQGAHGFVFRRDAVSPRGDTQDMNKAVAATLELQASSGATPLERWSLSGYLVEYIKAASGVSMISITGPGMYLPLHIVLPTAASRHSIAAESIRDLQAGRVPKRGVYRAKDLPPVRYPGRHAT